MKKAVFVIFLFFCIVTGLFILSNLEPKMADVSLLQAENFALLQQQTEASVSSAPSIKKEENHNIEKIFYISKENLADGLASLEKNWQKIDIIAPQLYSVNSNLMMSGGMSTELKQIVKEHNLKVMPLVVNAGFNKKIMQKLFLSKPAQDEIIKGMVLLAKKNNYIGWQFDFEHIDYTHRDLFSAFVERTYKEFQKNELILSVATVARQTDYEETEFFKNWSGVYDYERLANSTDFISLMVYDDPNSTGPTASIEFAEKCLEYARDKIPAEKLSFGIPLYFWKWNTDENKRIASGVFKNVLEIMENVNKHLLRFDEKLGVASLSYFNDKENHKVWFENGQSFKAKLDIIKNNKLRGFSAWVLGGEDPRIWDELN